MLIHAKILYSPKPSIIASSECGIKPWEKERNVRPEPGRSPQVLGEKFLINQASNLRIAPASITTTP